MRKKGKILRKNNRNGLGLRNKDTELRKSKEWVFFNNTNHMKYTASANGGLDILNHMIAYTKKYGCIPKLNYGGHGPSSKSKTDGNGLFTRKAYQAHLFMNGQVRESHIKSLSSSSRGRAYKYSGSLDEEVKGSNPQWERRKSLKHLIADGQVQFCSRCLVQIHSCNMGAKFAKKMAEVTGCQTVVGTGRVSVTRHNSDGSGDIYWYSADDRKNKNNGDMFYRATPIGKKIIEENIGPSYIAY